MLRGCRELALERMARSLSGMLDRLEDDLFDLAEKAADRESQNMYLDARSQAREKRSVMEATFSRHFVDFFNRKVRGDAAADAHARIASPASLSLVGDEDLEEALAVREMSRKLGAACEGELFALSQRMGFLLERPELEEDANPVSPSMICAALKDACDQIQASFKVRLALLRQLEGYAQAELQAVYHDLNVHLVERRILPEVRHGVRRTPSPARRQAPPAAPSTPPTPPQRSVRNAGAAAGRHVARWQPPRAWPLARRPQPRPRRSRSCPSSPGCIARAVRCPPMAARCS